MALAIITRQKKKMVAWATRNCHGSENNDIVLRKSKKLEPINMG